jgi:hypothetical protein
MTFSPLIPLWLMVVLTLCVGVLLIRTYGPFFGKPFHWLALTRTLALVVLLFYLANPVLIQTRDNTEKPSVVLVADNSHSMGIKDAAKDQTRLAEAQRIIKQLEQKLQPHYALQLFSLSDQLRSGLADQSSDKTDFYALARLADQSPEAIFFLSDGNDHGNEEPDQLLAQARIPVYAIPVGTQQDVANAAVRLEPISPSVFPTQDLTLDVVITSQGQAVGKPNEYIIYDAAGQELHRSTVTLARETRHTITVKAQSQPGEQRWRVAINNMSDEATEADNSAECAVRVIDKVLRIAVIEGQPYWDTSFAVRTWRRDRQFAVTTWYDLGTRRWNTGEEKLETITPEVLQRFEVVVIGQESEKFINAQAAKAISEFVEQGGSLLFLGIQKDGPTASLLAPINPLVRRAGRAQVAKPQLTASGRQFALLPQDQDFTAQISSGLIADVRPRSDILVGNHEQPIVVLRRYGAGQTAVVNAEGLWRWSLGERQKQAPAHDPAAMFWRQVMKLLAGDKQHGLVSDRPRYRVGQQARISSEISSDMQVTTPNGQPLTLSSDNAQVALTQSGRYSVVQGEQQLSLFVDPDVREQTQTARRDDRLARLSSVTNGHIILPEQAEQFAEQFARRADLRSSQTTIIPLITSPWWVMVVLAVLSFEWWIRRRRYGVT